ncbi:MAG: hypothetical protein ACR2OB_08285 [Solirubrobacteraceae bacterium]
MIASWVAALKTIADWAVDGDDFLPVRLYDRPTSWSREWNPGDVLGTQGDAHIHVDAGGTVMDVVPSVVGFAEPASQQARRRRRLHGRDEPGVASVAARLSMAMAPRTRPTNHEKLVSQFESCVFDPPTPTSPRYAALMKEFFDEQRVGVKLALCETEKDAFEVLGAAVLGGHAPDGVSTSTPRRRSISRSPLRSSRVPTSKASASIGLWSKDHSGRQR